MVISASDIDQAVRALAGVAFRTPLLHLKSIGEELGVDLYAKAENTQFTGSFKFRGAYNALASLTPEQRSRGVVTYSSGNHGQGLAAAARVVDTRAVIVMPENVVAAKVAGVERYGGEPLLVGRTIMERQSSAEELAQEQGLELIPPADDVRVMAGQATIGREILADAPDVDVVLVPIGAGGLISGVGSAIKAARPDIKVVGVEPAGKPAAFRSFAEGRRVLLEDVETEADGLRANLVGVINWEVMKEVVDDVILASEDAISKAMQLLALSAKQVVEAAGAVGLAALLDGQPALQGKKVALVVSGGNVDAAKLACILWQPRISANDIITAVVNGGR
jgi:threonine dehydratase